MIRGLSQLFVLVRNSTYTSLVASLKIQRSDTILKLTRGKSCPHCLMSEICTQASSLVVTFTLSAAYERTKSA